MMQDQNEKQVVSPSTEDHSSGQRVGAGLREVRERLGWKLPDIAARLRIREVFLVAIESGDLSSLPGSAYRTGFVRAYAQHLGLDGEEILQRFRAAGQMGETAKPELQLLAPVPDRAVPAGVVIFLCFVVVIIGYIVWYYHTEHLRKLAESVPHVPAELQPLAAPPKVVPPPPAVLKTTTLPTKIAPAATKPAATSPLATPASTTTAATPATPATPGTTTSPASSPAPAAPAAGMVITATQEAWIQVSAPNGTILFSKVLNPGQSWPVPDMPGLKMTTGNAGGTVITTNGQAGQPLGAVGVVLRGYQLTPPAPTPAASAPSQPSSAQGSAATPPSSPSASVAP